MRMQFLHYWLTVALIVAAAFEIPDYEQASYSMLLAITNMLFAIFWSIEEKSNENP